MNPITEIKVDGRKLKSYGLKIGEYFQGWKIVGMIIIKSNVNSFEFNKGEIRHMVQVEIDEYDFENKETMNREFEIDPFYPIKKEMEAQIVIDKVGYKAASQWKMADQKYLISYVPSIEQDG